MILTRGRWFIYYDADDSSEKTPYLISFEHSLYVDVSTSFRHNLTETCWENESVSDYDYHIGCDCSYCAEKYGELKKNLCEECFNEIKIQQHAAIFSVDVFHKLYPIRVHVYDPDNFGVTVNSVDCCGYIEHNAWYDGCYDDYNKIHYARFAHIMWLIRELGDVRVIIVSDMIQLSKNVREKINDIQRINDLP